MQCALGADTTTTEDMRRWAAQFIMNFITPHAVKGVAEGQRQWPHLSFAEVMHCELLGTIHTSEYGDRTPKSTGD